MTTIARKQCDKCDGTGIFKHFGKCRACDGNGEMAFVKMGIEPDLIVTVMGRAFQTGMIIPFRGTSGKIVDGEIMQIYTLDPLKEDYFPLNKIWMCMRNFQTRKISRYPLSGSIAMIIAKEKNNG